VTEQQVASRAEAAHRLRDAARTGKPCRPVRDLIGSTDVAGAYEVQQYNLQLAYNEGRRRIGRKIGLTARSVQAQLGVDQPDLGALLDDMLVPSGGVVPAGRLLQPRVEGEVAFRIGKSLNSENLTRDDMRDAIAGLSASIEIVDSRIAGWDISITDTVADNASSGMFVVSDDTFALSDVEPVSVEMTLELNGEIRSSGNGSACLGDPLIAVHWLAMTAARLGDPLVDGDIVLSGALGPMISVRPGDQVAVRISGLGDIRVGFEG
jgi:2-keto-4-pentenoate hydratase